jgi:hypothetical protein
VTLTFDLWPWKSIGFQTLLRTKYVPSLVKIHWRMLILECSQGYYTVKHLPSDLDLWANDPNINRVLPLPQGNHVAKFGKDPIYRTNVIVRKPVWTPAARHTQSHNMAPSWDGRIIKDWVAQTSIKCKSQLNL